MPDEVKYTTRPAAPRSRARVDNVPAALVVVPASVAREANADLRQRLSVHAGLPPHAIRTLATSEQDIILGRERNEDEGRRRVRELASAGIGMAALQSKATEVPRPAALVALGVFCGALGLAGATAGMAGVVLGLLGLARVFVGGPITIGSGASEKDRQALVDAHDAQLQTLEAKKSSWTALHEVRARTLDPDLPPSAAADAWSALDAIEEALLAGEDVHDELTQLLVEVDAADPSPAGAASEAATRLRTALHAAKGAVEETSRLSAARQQATRERS